MSATADKHKNVVHFDQLRNELFLHEYELHEEIAETITKLGSISSAALLLELIDKQKATVQYISSSDGKIIWKNTSLIDHKAGFQKVAVNDPAESYFGGTTRQLH